MRIAAVIVTHNRLALLPRALKSVANQTRQPDSVFVISNSDDHYSSVEAEICSDFGFNLIRNYRTENYAGALNTAIEEIIKLYGYEADLYFASLDDDDEWLLGYLDEIEKSNDNDYDVLAANYLRLSDEENLLMALPEKLSEKDFLIGNPGIGGSNTCIRLKTLLKAGCFDEALPATVDRDIFVRVFQQKPTYRIISKHLVTAHTDKDRERVTTDTERKKHSFRIFYYKYSHLMNEIEKNQFFERAKSYFSVGRDEIKSSQTLTKSPTKQSFLFNQKGDYEFIIGFIAGNEIIAENIARELTDRNVSVDKVVIIDDVPKGKTLKSCEDLFQAKDIPYTIVKHHQWKENLKNGHYGSYFKQFSEINSIPLGRTILHHHLYTETVEYKKPVYWIIDDDISFSALTISEDKLDIFKLITQNIDTADAIIGSISQDPPVPALCCMRAQLLDLLHSSEAKSSEHKDLLNIKAKPDYYYDLSDVHSDHLEIPIYYNTANEKDLKHIFAGKAVSRPALQRDLKTESKTITKRGANTLVFNRELLQYYPVINLEVNNKFARRGDLLWALLNQVVSGRKILEHTFSLDHNRQANDFDLEKELDKSAYDIIGYAFNKGVLKVIEKIKEETEPNRPKDIFEKLNREEYYEYFQNIYNHFLDRRKARFIMNYFRITGLTKLLSQSYVVANIHSKQLSDENRLSVFENTLNDAKQDKTLKPFFRELTTAIWTYSKSITDLSESDEKYRIQLEDFFNLRKKLRKLGNGAEGIAFTDDNFVYKSYFNILDNEWNFLKEKANCFPLHPFLEKIDFFEDGGNRFIRYPYFLFKPISEFEPVALTSFLKFCKSNGFVYTNIKPSNFIQANAGSVKLIDYGKSFEPFTNEKYINSIKRAFLLYKFPFMKNEDFQKLTAQINIGEEPYEIKGWEHLYLSVEPRKKEDILDKVIVSIIKQYNPIKILDYGSGKCKTAKLLQSETQADVHVYDVKTDVMKTRCSNFKKYYPSDSSFSKFFDVVLLNLVLCEIDNSVAQEILTDILKVVKQNGIVVVSICNPDFAHVKRMEFQNRDSIPKVSSKEEVLKKTCIYTGNEKTEYFRPSKKYLDLFAVNGFVIQDTIDTEGTDIETLTPASDFKIFVLER